MTLVTSVNFASEDVVDEEEEEEEEETPDEEEDEGNDSEVLFTQDIFHALF